MRLMIPSKIWLGFDWSQAELRFLCMFSKDSVLRDALNSGDVHSYVASLLFDKDISDVGKLEREDAKTFQYELIYSGFDINVAGNSFINKYPKCDQVKVWEYLNKYKEIFFQLFNWVSSAVMEWYDNEGVVRYFMGAEKKIQVPPYFRGYDIHRLLSSKPGRIAINTYGQNSVGLFMKMILSEIYKNKEVYSSCSQFIPVFDAIYFLCESDKSNKVIEFIDSVAGGIIEDEGFSVAMNCDWMVSFNSWGDMNRIDISECKELKNMVWKNDTNLERVEEARANTLLLLAESAVGGYFINPEVLSDFIDKFNEEVDYIEKDLKEEVRRIMGWDVQKPKKLICKGVSSRR